MSNYFLKEIVTTKFSERLESVRKTVRDSALINNEDSKSSKGSPILYAFNKSIPDDSIMAFKFDFSSCWSPNSLLHCISRSRYKIFWRKLIEGLAPWNYIACKAGVFISRFSSKAEILDADTYQTVTIKIK